ncbi:Hypothetical protein NTJ_11933 [Nesidiocoris tenuis]|uniref:Uncharacterized protein n=1 Tax=Nesidiocoris tenuis TaxID=355587 RepID=A0ABN7B3Y1_9HEMI|nr:Hypothetical protein NTJ_11933 [Nesidiocoris tenuis]
MRPTAVSTVLLAYFLSLFALMSAVDDLKSRQIISAPYRNPCSSGYAPDSSGKCKQVVNATSTSDYSTNYNNSNSNNSNQQVAILISKSRL